MAARYVMDRNEVAKLLEACKSLGCIDVLDAKTRSEEHTSELQSH